ncbi:MAG: hypothetical protein P4L90_27280 [Rhodopila sp.]|nr:hypothetical protein [Rhodopila sp.]
MQPKLVPPKLAPGPPPLPQPSPPRLDAADTQSVLARLRQLSPAAAPVPPVNVPPVPEQRTEPVSSPSVSRLIAARAALGNGRIEEARRLLQEAQLQLVFRPVTASGNEPPSAGRGASDVAHALEALSANDVPRSRRFIDRAVDDISGIETRLPIQESNTRATGYAPAYPPR